MRGAKVQLLQPRDGFTQKKPRSFAGQPLAQSVDGFDLYEGHHYLDEKCHALETLLNQLESNPATGDNVRMLHDASGALRVVA